MCPAWLRILQLDANIDPKADLTTNFPKKQPSCFLRPTPEERRQHHSWIPHVGWSIAKRLCCRISSRRCHCHRHWCGHPNRLRSIRPRSGYPMSPPAPGSARHLKAQLQKKWWQPNKLTTACATLNMKSKPKTNLCLNFVIMLAHIGRFGQTSKNESSHGAG